MIECSCRECRRKKLFKDKRLEIHSQGFWYSSLPLASCEVYDFAGALIIKKEVSQNE